MIAQTPVNEIMKVKLFPLYFYFFVVVWLKNICHFADPLIQKESFVFFFGTSAHLNLNWWGGAHTRPGLLSTLYNFNVMYVEHVTTCLKKPIKLMLILLYYVWQNCIKPTYFVFQKNSMFLLRLKICCVELRENCITEEQI